MWRDGNGVGSLGMTRPSLRLPPRNEHHRASNSGIFFPIDIRLPIDIAIDNSDAAELGRAYCMCYSPPRATVQQRNRASRIMEPVEIVES